MYDRRSGRIRRGEIDDTVALFPHPLGAPNPSSPRFPTIPNFQPFTHHLGTPKCVMLDGIQSADIFASTSIVQVSTSSQLFVSPPSVPFKLVPKQGSVMKWPSYRSAYLQMVVNLGDGSRYVKSPVLVIHCNLGGSVEWVEQRGVSDILLQLG